MTSIAAVELWRLDLELRHRLATSGGAHDWRPVILLFVHTEDATGVGECEALAMPTYTEEYADGAEAILTAHLIPRLIAGGDFDELEGALARLAPVRGHPMAKAGLEMALLDACLRTEGRSLGGYLGATATHIPAGANVGIGTPEEVLAAITEAVSAGYRRVKVKIAPGQEVDQLRAARAAFPDLALSVDANGAYDEDTPGHLEALDALDTLDLFALEQPFGAGELLGMGRLAERLEVPVVLDESIASLADLETACALDAIEAVSVKPARLGGLLIARALHDRCRERGIALSIGGMLESGVGRAAALALGALPGFTLPGDLGASERYFLPDLSPPHVLLDGELAVPDGPGIGVVPDRALLEQLVVRRALFEAP